MSSYLSALVCLSTLAFAPETLEKRLLQEDAGGLATEAVKKGEARNGARVFYRQATACTKCHSTGKGMSPLGPDLAKLGKETKVEHIVESILKPSKIIDKKYKAVQVVTGAGQPIVGFVVKESPTELVVRDAVNIGKVVSLKKEDLESRIDSPVSVMPVGVVNQLKDRQEFLDLVKYVAEITRFGPAMARKLEPDDFELRVLAKPIDHAKTIRTLAADKLTVGKELYAQYCVNCHGSDGNKTINPLSRRFAKDPLKFGTDPYSMWKTITYGNGLMLPQSALLSPEERYLVVNYIREAFIRKPNPSQYYAVADEYLKGVNAKAKADADKLGVKVGNTKLAAGMIDSNQGRNMDYGPYMSHSVVFTKPKDINAPRFEDSTERALVIELPGANVACYDIDRFSVSALWQGKLANTAKTHHTSYKGSTCLTPGGPVLYKNVDDRGWAIGKLDNPATEATSKFVGHYLHGTQVLLQYEVGSRGIDELPSCLPDDRPRYSRTLRVGAGPEKLFCLVARLKGGSSDVSGMSASLSSGKESIRTELRGDRGGLEFVADSRGGLWVSVPASTKDRTFTVWYARGKVGLGLPKRDASVDLDALTEGGPKRWRRSVVLPAKLGESMQGYAADHLPVPLANPWGSWMRMTALDFFSDGRAAASTLSGDVWIVRWLKPDLSDATWTRFATGLYEPLGLRIVDDLVYVRGRDRITRLRDLNDDGEADFYESFFQEGEIGSGYHAFQFDLQTDRKGNFYFSKSGRKSPHKGGVVRVSADGKRSEMVCFDFRHPNGMGAGGPHDWITVADNPHGKEVYNGVAIVREGRYYGYEHSRTTPMLAVLPPTIDSSSAGQCWSDPKRWGPLSGQMVHTSYSGCRMLYILTQNVEPYPNGFAIPMPFAFPVGLMRARTNPVDGQVYVIGQKGWDTKAPLDGGLYRIRYVPGTAHLISGAKATTEGIRLTFSCDLDPKSITKKSVAVVQEEEKKTKPYRMGDVRVVDARTILVELPDIGDEVVAKRSKKDKKTGRTTIGVNWPIRLSVSVRAKDGTSITQTVYATVNSLAK